MLCDDAGGAWMSARVVSVAPGAPRDGEGRAVWTLSVEGDDVSAVFLTDRRVADLDCFQELWVRARGESWTPPPPPEFVTAQDLADAEAAWTRRLRVDVADLAMTQALADAAERYPDADPRTLAEALRESVDFFQDAVARAADTVGPDGVFGAEQLEIVKDLVARHVAAKKAAGAGE